MWLPSEDILLGITKRWSSSMKNIKPQVCRYWPFHAINSEDRRVELVIKSDSLWPVSSMSNSQYCKKLMWTVQTLIQSTPTSEITALCMMLIPKRPKKFRGISLNSWWTHKEKWLDSLPTMSRWAKWYLKWKITWQNDLKQEDRFTKNKWRAYLKHLRVCFDMIYVNLLIFIIILMIWD